MDSNASSAGRSANRKLDGNKPPADLSSAPTVSLREKGFATLLILLLFSAFATFGLEAYLKAQSENRMAKREALSRQAVYASEGGLEWAKSELIINPVFTGGKRTIGEGTVVIKATVGEGGYWVTSDAQNGLVRRKIQVFLSPDSLDPGHWIMSQYQEIYQ